VCDDAFISFRYAENLAGGKGLVFNEGERVEGYTNFLWTVVLAGASAAGLSPLAASEALGLVAFGGLTLLLLRRSWVRSRDERVPFVPLATALLLVFEDLRVWATGGLETMLFTLLAVAALLATRAARPSLPWRLFTGVLFGLLVLTRPDGVVFAAVGAVSVALPSGERPAARDVVRRVATTFAPTALLLLGFLLFKISYYGEWLPTAFYSKSATRPYYEQGLLYLALFLAKNWILVPLFALPVALGIAARVKRTGRPTAWTADETVFLAAAVLFTAYVAHSGGDFMFARRLVPALPFALLCVEGVLVRTLPEPALLVTGALALAGALVPFPVFAGETLRLSGIADEPRFYTKEVIALRRSQGEIVGRELEGSGARVLLGGGMCVFGYYSRLPYLVEMTGLTQYSLARLPLEKRGHVGHEKSADAAWLTKNRIHFVLSQAFPPIPAADRGRRPDEIFFGDAARAQVWVYSDEVMDRLRGRPGVSFLPIEEVLARTEAALAADARGPAALLLAFLERYDIANAPADRRDRARRLLSRGRAIIPRP